MTNQPTNPTPFPATPIRTPGAATLEMLERIAAGIETQNAQLEFLTGEIRHLIEISESAAEVSQDVAEGLARFGASMSTLSPLASTTPAAPGTTFVFVAEAITMGYDDKTGKPVYKIRGGTYQKFGVRCWDEVLPLLGIEASTLKPGPNAFSAPVIALMGEKGPQKVIGLAK